MDRWCLESLFRELLHEYQHGDLDGWPEAGRFSEYLEWIAEQAPENAEAFWRGHLAAFTEPTLLADRLTSSVATTASHRRDLGVPLANDLQAAAVRNRVSTATLLQAGLALVLAEASQRRDVVYGLTVSGRPPGLPDVETIMGSFINTVPTRVDLRDGSLALGDWLRSLQRLNAQRSAHEYLALPDIQAVSEVPLNRPLFDVLLVLNTAVRETLDGPGFTLRQVADPDDSNFPLNLLVEQDEGLEVVAVYRDDVFDGDSVDELLRSFESKVAALSAGTADTVEDLVTHIPVAERSSAAVAARPVDPTLPPVEKLRLLFARALGLDHVGLDDDFFALGGSSVQAAALFTDIERHFSTSLSLSTVLETGSVRGLMATLADPEPRRTPLVTFQSRGEGAPIFVVPGVGGNVVGLNPLARACGPHQPFHGFESPGLDGGESPLKTIEAIARRYVEAMEPQRSSVVLCGICWGAVVAFEMAQQLTKLGREPALLVMLDPSLADEETPPADAPSPRLGFVRSRLALYREDMEGLSLGERAGWAVRKAARLLRTAADKEARQDTYVESRQQLVRDLNVRAHSLYRPRPYAGKTLLLFTSERSLDAATDPRLAWRRFLPGDTDEDFVPGATTGETLEATNARVLARHIVGRASAISPSRSLSASA
jgi:thioesterase domain-containing protein